MKVYVKLKSFGKRRPILDGISYIIPDGVITVKQLIEAIVVQEVDKYNERGVDEMLIPFLTEEEIENQSSVGKVGFGRLYSDKKVQPKKAKKTALLGFEDGLVRVLINDIEVVDLDEIITINENDSLTFIRLTFLSGRLW